MSSQSAQSPTQTVLPPTRPTSKKFLSCVLGSAGHHRTSKDKSYVATDKFVAKMADNNDTRVCNVGDRVCNTHYNEVNNKKKQVSNIHHITYSPSNPEPITIILVPMTLTRS